MENIPESYENKAQIEKNSICNIFGIVDKALKPMIS